MLFANKFSQFCIGNANELISILKYLPIWFMYLLSSLLPILWIAGGALERLNILKAPYLSTVIRNVGEFLNIIGIVLMIVLAMYCAGIVFLVFFGYSISPSVPNPNYIEILQLSIRNIWLTAPQYWTAIIVGLAVGVAIAFTLSVKVIPSFSRGKGLSDVQEAVLNFQKMDKYDPKIYFNKEKGCFIGLN